jgi:hypothetical protein
VQRQSRARHTLVAVRNLWRHFDAPERRTKTFPDIKSLSRNSYFGFSLTSLKFVGVIVFHSPYGLPVVGEYAGIWYGVA